MGDISAKLGAGSVKAVSASARALATASLFIPILFKETYADVYPVAGDAYYYKGAPIADIGAAATSLESAAEELMTIAEKEDKAGAQAQAAKISGVCGSCHTPYRGQYK